MFFQSKKQFFTSKTSFDKSPRAKSSMNSTRGESMSCGGPRIAERAPRAIKRTRSSEKWRQLQFVKELSRHASCSSILSPSYIYISLSSIFPCARRRVYLRVEIARENAWDAENATQLPAKKKRGKSRSFCGSRVSWWCN